MFTVAKLLASQVHEHLLTISFYLNLLSEICHWNHRAIHFGKRKRPH